MTAIARWKRLISEQYILNSCPVRAKGAPRLQRFA